MSTAEQPPIYNDLVDLLVETADTNRLLAFRLSPDKQSRLDELLERNRSGNQSEADVAELDAYEQFEHVVRLLKARLLQKQRP